MKVDFSQLDARRRPVLVLKNLDGMVLQTLGYAFNVEIELSFNEVSTLTFTLPAQVDGSPTPHYDEVVGMRIVELVGVGQFYLLDPSEESDGTRRVKMCKAYSLEYEFAKKNIFLEAGTYNFYDGLNQDNPDTIIGRIREVMPDWNVSFDSAALGDLVGRYRTFDDINKKVYEFMKSDVQEKYGCIFDFDTMTRTIHVVSATAPNNDIKQVYLSEDNLIKKIKVDEDSDGIVTCLNVYGDEGVDIRSVNPTGENKIYNLNYFMNIENFNQGLIDKWRAWEAAVDAQRDNYYNIQMQYNMLLLQILMAENGLSDTKKSLSTLQNQQASIIQGISTGVNTQGNLTTVNGQIATANASAASSASSIAAMKIQAAALLTQMQEINASLAMDAVSETTTESIAPCPRATFSNGVGNVPLIGLTVSFQPSQNLNGYDRPWAGGAGDNKFNALDVIDENRYVSATTGKTAAPSASSGAVWRYTDFIPVTPGDTLYFGEINATASAAGTAFYSIADQTGYISGRTATQLGNANNVLTVPEGAAYMRHSFRIDAGYNTDWETSVYIVHNDAVHQWSPYANICPITGYGYTFISVSPTLNASDGTTYAAQFGSAVYGGTVNVTTGALTATYGVISSYNNETLPGTWLSDRDLYAAGTTPTVGAKVVYELESPVVHQITPVEVQTIAGTNNIWADIGNVSVTYYTNIGGYIYFTPDELTILRRYFIEDTIQDNSFVASNVSTYDDTSMNIDVNNTVFTITNGIVTQPSNTSYQVRGGTVNFGTLSGEVTYAYLSMDAEYKFTFAVSLGQGRVGEATFGNGNLVLCGTYTSVTAVDTTPGGSLSLSISSGKMNFSQDANEYQRHQVEWELLQYGESVLHEKASPTYYFSVECANFLNLDDFWLFKSQLEFGKKVYLNLGDGIYNPYVIAFHMTYEDASSCTISFSDSYTSFDRSFSLAKLLEQSVSMGKALSYKSGQYSAFVNSGASSQVKEFIDSALDIAKNAVLSTDSQDITIDDTGIRLRKYKKDGSGNYVVDPTGARTHEPEEIWMTDSSILFTDDNWATAKMAIGKIYRQGLVAYKPTTDTAQNNAKTYYVNQYGTVWDPSIYGAWSTDLYEIDDQGTDGFGYGIIADYLIGKMIVGQNMIIECPDPNGNTMLFKVDGSGATINNGTLKIENATNVISLDPTDGFKITQKNGIGSTVKFYVDTNGNVNFKGDLSGANGTFGDGNAVVMLGNYGIGIGGQDMSYTTPSGSSGGWSNANFYVDQTGNVHFAGDLSGSTGTFSGQNSKVIIGPGGIGIGGTNLDYNGGLWSNATFFTDPLGNVHFSGALEGATGTFSGALNAASGTFAGSLIAATGTFSGTVRASDFEAPTGQVIWDPTTEQYVPEYTSMLNSSGQFKAQYLEVTGSTVQDIMAKVAQGTNGIYLDQDGNYYLNATYLKAGQIDTRGLGLAGLQVGKYYGHLLEYAGETAIEGQTYSTSGIQIEAESTSTGDVGNVAASDYGAHMRFRKYYTDPYTGMRSLVSTDQIWVAQGVCAASSPPLSSSDRRMKHDISYNVDTYDDFFNALSPAIYKPNDGMSNRFHIGFIAQDVESALSGAGLTNQDFAGLVILDYGKDVDDQEIEERGFIPHQYGLRYTEFIALNTHMIQKLTRRVEALEAQLSAQG